MKTDIGIHIRSIFGEDGKLAEIYFGEQSKLEFFLKRLIFTSQQLSYLILSCCLIFDKCEDEN